MHSVQSVFRNKPPSEWCTHLLGGCVQEFVKAVIAYQKKLNSLTSVPKPLKLDKEMEKKRKIIVRSFSLAKNLYNRGQGLNPSKDSELQAGADFLEV